MTEDTCCGCAGACVKPADPHAPIGELVCKDAAGFEDKLHVNKRYDLHKVGDSNDVLVNVGDRENPDLRWYGLMHFRLK